MHQSASYMCRSRVSFFFKQKTAYEMRISDGVQTCALPISRRSRRTADVLLAQFSLHHVRGSPWIPDRKSVVSGKSVSVRVDLGGRRIIKKKTGNLHTSQTYNVNSSSIIHISCTAPAHLSQYHT